MIIPAVVILPMLLPAYSVNHRLPSGPPVMLNGLLPAVGAENSVITPAVVILPILFAVCLQNHRLPSGPLVIPDAPNGL